MMSVPPSGVLSLDLPNDRSSAQLRAYLRDEYHADIGWLERTIRSERAPRRGRLRRWLATRRSRPELPSPRRSTAATSAARSSASPVDAQDCSHPMTEDLGLGGETGFLRCAICGDVIVVRGARQWRIRSSSDGDMPALAANVAEHAIEAEL